GPIEALAREQLDLAMVEPGLDAVAVELDLVHPALPARRRRTQGGERRRHERGQARAVEGFVSAVLAALGLDRGDPARRPRPAACCGCAGAYVVGSASVGMPPPLAALAFGDLRDRAAADHRARLFLENIGIAGAAGGLVLGLDQQPRHLLFAGAAAHAHEMPSPVQLLALEFKVQMT